MHLALVKALKSATVPGADADADATATVEAMEVYMASRMAEVVKGLDAQNKGIEAKLDALRANLTFTTILLGIIGLAIAAGPIVAKFIP